jgi:hypothetical protein
MTQRATFEATNQGVSTVGARLKLPVVAGL